MKIVMLFIVFVFLSGCSFERKFEVRRSKEVRFPFEKGDLLNGSFSEHNYPKNLSKFTPHVVYSNIEKPAHSLLWTIAVPVGEGYLKQTIAVSPAELLSREEMIDLLYYGDGKRFRCVKTYNLGLSQPPSNFRN